MVSPPSPMVVAIAAASTGEPSTPASTLSATVPSAQSVPLTTAMSTGSRSASFASASVGGRPKTNQTAVRRCSHAVHTVPTTSESATIPAAVRLSTQPRSPTSPGRPCTSSSNATTPDPHTLEPTPSAAKPRLVRSTTRNLASTFRRTA